MLARRFGAPEEKAELAGLLHDLCRELPDDETLAAAARHGIPVGPTEARRPRKILHGPVAAAELAERGAGPGDRARRSPCTRSATRA